MDRPEEGDLGFTLVELMIVVLVIGMLVTIAVPVYQVATAQAETSACQANQRAISEAIDLYVTNGGSTLSASDGQLAAGGSGWYGILIPGWVKRAPSCPKDGANYLLDAAGNVVGDQGALQGFKAGHALP